MNLETFDPSRGNHYITRPRLFACRKLNDSHEIILNFYFFDFVDMALITIIH